MRGEHYKPDDHYDQGNYQLYIIIIIVDGSYDQNNHHHRFNVCSVW